MSGLKDLRMRIKSVKSTQKITSAMKMVAAAKLRKAQEKAEKTRPYAEGIKNMLTTALQAPPDLGPLTLLLTGNPAVTTELIVVVTSDRGLCGGFNTNIVRGVKNLIKKRDEENIPVKLFCVGRKGYELLKREHASKIIAVEADLTKTTLQFSQIAVIAKKLEQFLSEGTIRSIRAVYSVFKSAISQQITQASLVPFEVHKVHEQAITEYEPSHTDVVLSLLPKNLATQLFEIILETNASEHGARMTAMDNATRNARDVIQKLELTYNRTRQAYITKELIEIISGVEAL